MAASLTSKNGETAAHSELKRLTLIWAQAQAYSVCALEVQLPRCRFRADVAAYRSERGHECCAVFECKQAASDLRRDNCHSAGACERLTAIAARLQVIERNLRVHYPMLRAGESLFQECDHFDFARLSHREYRQLNRQKTALRSHLVHGTKFETLCRYHCANLFYLVVPVPLQPRLEVPAGWGVLVQKGPELELVQRPVWLDMRAAIQHDFLVRVGRAATRAVNRGAGVTREQLSAARVAAGHRDWHANDS